MHVMDMHMVRGLVGGEMEVGFGWVFWALGGLVLEGVVLSEGVSGLCLWEVNGTTPNG